MIHPLGPFDYLPMTDIKLSSHMSICMTTTSRCSIHEATFGWFFSCAKSTITNDCWILSDLWSGITLTVLLRSTQLRLTVVFRASQYCNFVSDPSPGNRFTPLLYPDKCFLHFRLLYHPDTVPSVILATHPTIGVHHNLVLLTHSSVVYRT